MSNINHVKICVLKTSFKYILSLENDREYFHHLEKFSNTLESSITKNIMSSPKKFLVTKTIVGQKGSVAPCATPRPNDRQVHKGRQILSLTSRDTLHPNNRHVSGGRQVHKCGHNRRGSTPLPSGSRWRKDGVAT